MKILVVGSDGMLGRDVMSILSKDPEVMGVSQTALQLADFERVREIFTRYRPVVVIHAAEATDLDRCEAHPWEALHVNALGTQNIVTACQEVDAALLYLSSDQVFSGARRGPYVEWDIPRPVNIYGHTKMAGEMAVKDHLRKFFIVRTSTVYGHGTPGFVQEVLQAGKEGRPFMAASDEITCPTFSQDLALALARLAGTRFYGTYHITNGCGHEGVTWADFARAILEEAGLSPDLVEAVPGEALERGARRPARPVLGNTFFRMRKVVAMRAWREALAAFIHQPVAAPRPAERGPRSRDERFRPPPAQRSRG